MKKFESFIGPQINEYFAYRQSLGYKTTSHRSYMITFDRLLKDHQKPGWDLLQPSFFLELRANLKLEKRTINRIFSTLRVFFQFLVRRGYLDENPLRDIPFLRENTIVPFVFSPEQTDQLLHTICRKIRTRENHFLIDLSIYIAVLLLARCGLRISEPLRLMHNHYRKDDGTLYIEKTKFDKHRLIPVPICVMKEIENYLSVRKALIPHAQNPYLLTGIKKRFLTDRQVRYVFHEAVKDIGLDQPKRVIGNVNFSQPTPHCLRHSFAVNTLIKIKERGQSPQHALPIMAAYMGHKEYKYTSIYLRVADAQSRKNLVDFSLWQKRKE